MAQNANIDNMPAHVAIIMDGNGRWAKQQNKPRLFGHINGVNAVRRITEAAARMGIKYLTLYTFSTENWNRPTDEVTGLMQLLAKHLVSEQETFNNNNVRLQCIGALDQLPEKAQILIDQCQKATATNTGMTLVLALSYSSRLEITEAMRKIAQQAVDGTIKPNEITTETISRALYTADIPDPDLMIRTSGELRLSNYLLWQSAYTEFYFTSTLWPDFSVEEFQKAINDFVNRERRFGKTSEQLK